MRPQYATTQRRGGRQATTSLFLPCRVSVGPDGPRMDVPTYTHLGTPSTDGRNAPRTTETITERDYIRHNFIGAGQIGQNQGQLRNPDNPDHILESTDKIRNYRDTYRRNRHVAFLPACMSTSGRIHGELLRLIFFLSHQKGGRLFCGPWLSAAQTRGLSPSRRFLLAKQVLHQDGMCSGCGFA